MNTNIDNLKNINKDDTEIVDSILRDLNKKESNDETESKENLMERQKLLEEAQAQAIMQEKIANMNMVNQNMNMNSNNTIDTIISKVKLESKEIFLVILLVFISNLKQSSNILSYYAGAFVEGSTTELTIQGIMIKSLVVGILYFLVKSQFF